MQAMRQTSWYSTYKGVPRTEFSGDKSRAANTILAQLPITMRLRTLRSKKHAFQFSRRSVPFNGLGVSPAFHNGNMFHIVQPTAACSGTACTHRFHLNDENDVFNRAYAACFTFTCSLEGSRCTYTDQVPEGPARCKHQVRMRWRIQIQNKLRQSSLAIEIPLSREWAMYVRYQLHHAETR